LAGEGFLLRHGTAQIVAARWVQEAAFDTSVNLSGMGRFDGDVCDNCRYANEKD